MTTIVIEIVIILLLLVANGVFAMTEMAVVSARKAKLKRLSDAGDAGARLALELAESPNRFLPTVQIGITLVGLLAAAFGGIILMGRLNSAQPNVAVGFELDAIAAPVIGGVSLFGGVGTMSGTVIGALIMGTLSNGMNLLGTDPYLQQVIKGVVFMLAVAWDFYSKRKR